MDYNVNIDDTDQVLVSSPSARAPRNGYISGGKRALDILGGTVGLILFGPVMLILLVLSALDGGNPVYGHKRVGKDGRIFKCWKIRSMVLNADAALEAHLAANPEAAAEWAEHQKLTQDPRITRIGRILRKTSLDELPQFWNLLVGDMSLVGPRPVTEAEISRFKDFAELRSTVRPGVTGLWQVKGRNAVSYDERITLDSQYLRELSFKSDLGILFATVGVMVRGSGR